MQAGENDWQNEDENPTKIGTVTTDRICVDQAQTVCTADTQEFISISTSDSSDGTSGKNAVTSDVESVTDIVQGLYKNGAIDRASIELHWDQATPESSTIEFGAAALASEGWFSLEQDHNVEMMGMDLANGWALRLYGTDELTLEEDHDVIFGILPFNVWGLPAEIADPYLAQLLDLGCTYNEQENST